MGPSERPVIAHIKARSKHSLETETAWHLKITLSRKKKEEKCINIMIGHLKMILGHDFFVGMQNETWTFKLMIRFLIHTLELKLWLFKFFLYVEAMYLQCFPPTLRVCALLENASFWTCLQSMAQAVLHGFWTFLFFFCIRCLKKKKTIMPN